MRYLLCALALGAALTASAPSADVVRPTAADRADWTAACETYRNRARFLSRARPVSFVTLLAEACAATLRSLDAGRPAERVAAARFLDRMTALRDVIARMNVERAYGSGTAARVRPLAGPRLRQVAGVSATGEYLIAHEIGVQQAFGAWLDTGVAFSLASR